MAEHRHQSAGERRPRGAADRRDRERQVVATADRPWESLHAAAPSGSSGELKVTIRAYDYAGNYTDASTTVIADAAAPVASIASPADNAHVRSGPVDVVVRVADTSSPVASITSHTDPDATFARVPGTNDWAGTVTPPPSGYFQVDIKGANNISIVRTKQLVLDDQGPAAARVTPADHEIVPGTFTSKLDGVTDATGVAKAELWVGGKLTGTDLTEPYAMTAKAATGPGVEVLWRLTDTLGNIGTYRRSVTVDASGPTADAVHPAHRTRVRGTFASSLGGVQDVAGGTKAELWANGKYVGADTSAPYSLAVKTGRFSGNVNLSWKLTDRFGNARTYTRQVIADNKGPTLTITKAPKNKAKVRGTVKVSAKASDAGGIAQVELIVNGKVVAKDTKAGYVLSVNTTKWRKTMKVRVRAYDKLGNVTYSSTRTWYRT